MSEGPEVEYPTDVIAYLFDMTPRRVGQLVDLGLPKAGRNRFPLVACVRWYIEYLKGNSARPAGDRLKEQKERLVKAQVDLKEIELAVRRGELLPADKIKGIMRKHIGAARTRLMAIKAELAPILLELLERDEAINVVERIDDAVHQALTDLAGYKF